ncbi:hypothetical protein TSUD_129770 [Trifolium subterraneum]|uniref:Endonuclease/exonuclease/phosphatase domain-containing protein n=1 Tax=Trifolium subterraneum TaxID=3900 RepID=A0A2Z6MHZ2_TRISU|nr:hypothetical protein TSUD_129770 [Trifolium subterraneum]
MPNLDHNPLVGNLNLNSEGGCVSVEGGVDKELIINVRNDMLMGQECSSSGPVLGHNSLNIDTGSAVSRKTQYEVLGISHKPKSLKMLDRGGLEEKKGGVYSDGPMSVYRKLNNDEKISTTPKANTSNKRLPSVPPSAFLCKIQLLTRSFPNHRIRSSSTNSVTQPAMSVEKGGADRDSDAQGVVRRNLDSQAVNISKSSCSVCRNEDVLICGSINSSDIRNCNKIFLHNYKQKVASKFWNGAIDLGVEVNSDGKYVKGVGFQEGMGEGEELHIVNIYSPCNISGKKQLWDNLLALKQNSGGGKWCVGGDFNVILHASERKGISTDSRQGERILFNRFVEEMELVDVPVLGKKFTWFSADGKSMSRIDRFFMSDGFAAKYDITGQSIRDRDISDHFPVWLIVSSNNWGPKPFRVINGWLDHPDFFPFVENTWKSFDVHGKKAFILKEKFKLLKGCLRKWNREVYGYLDLNIDKTVNDINDIESLLGGDDLENEMG